jgi:hypothetical protein
LNPRSRKLALPAISETHPTHASLLLTRYTAGRFGVDDTGSIKMGFRFGTDFGPVRFVDPAGLGFTTVEASNGATLETKWEFKRSIRPWSRSRCSLRRRRLQSLHRDGLHVRHEFALS